MGSEWMEMPLENCMDAIIDYRGKTPRKTKAGIPLITAKIIKDGAIQPVSEFIAEEDYENWMRRGLPLPGDIVMTTEAPLGEIAQLDGKKIALAQRVITLRGKRGFLDNGYLKYLMQSQYVQHQLDGRGTGTTVKGIKQSELRQITLRFPAFTEQRVIALILGTLDDKIALNCQMNTTLEAMAQTLFKSWFVDFDPVIDNALAAGSTIPEPLHARAEARKALGGQRKPLPATIQQQFPDRFVFTEEMGWVPEGWEVSSIGSKIDLAYGKSLAVSKRIPGLIPVYGSGGATGFHSAALVSGPGVVVGRKGTVGSLYWVEKDFFPIDTVFYVVNNSGLPLYWIYQALQLLDIKSMGADSAVPGVNRNVIYSKKMVFPKPCALEEYSKQMSAISSQKRALDTANEALTALRDTLLPKLLSGELRISDAEAQTAEVL